MLPAVKLIRILLFLMVLSGIVACGSSEDASSSSSVLNRGLSAEPESLDAHKARSLQAADVLRDLGEGLVSFTATGELTAGAAESWEVSDDLLTYTFHLRPDAKWSNGDALTAEHFVFAINRLVDPATAAFYAQFLEDVSEMKAIDDHTLQVVLARPTPYLLSLLTHPATFPMHPGSLAKQGENFARPGDLVTNGAYVLTAWIPGSLLTLVRNEHYWNNANTAIDEVRYHILSQETTEYARYRAGELDITSAVPSDNFEEVKRVAGQELHIAPVLNIYYYGYNLTKPPFKDNPELRQALSMAIDRELLVEKVTGRGETPAYSWVPPGVDNYEPTQLSFAALTQEERNQLAQTLYAEAGYSAENPLQLELRYNTGDTHKKIALAIQSMWREVLGFEVVLVNEEFQVLLANIRDKEITQVFRSSWIGDYNDAHTFLNILQSKNAANVSGYASEEYDALLERAAEQVDLSRRRLYLEEAERVMLADYPAIPIYFYVSKHLVKPRVAGWGDNVLDYHYSQHLSLKAEQ
ncbi:MAG: peptide ABC transporter substrate-binding protein [Woeseiaceae bacterium]|nr:peptide ABC transporter substrate-binding protein [Woeseiaceae bacterium]